MSRADNARLDIRSRLRPQSRPRDRAPHGHDHHPDRWRRAARLCATGRFRAGRWPGSAWPHSGQARAKATHHPGRGKSARGRARTPLLTAFETLLYSTAVIAILTEAHEHHATSPPLLTGPARPFRRVRPQLRRGIKYPDARRRARDVRLHRRESLGGCGQLARDHGLGRTNGGANFWGIRPVCRVGRDRAKALRRVDQRSGCRARHPWHRDLDFLSATCAAGSQTSTCLRQRLSQRGMRRDSDTKASGDRSGSAGRKGMAESGPSGLGRHSEVSRHLVGAVRRSFR